MIVAFSIMLPFIAAACIPLLYRRLKNIRLGWFVLVVPVLLFSLLATYIPRIANGHTFVKTFEWIDQMKPIFEVFGQNIVYQGAAGSGQHTKMCNQIAIASGMIGVCESIAYGLNAGLDLEDVLRSISAGAAGSWSLSNLAPRMLKEDYAPGFYIKHIIKDMKIALDEAERMNLQLPGLSLAKSMYDKLLDEGYGDNGTQALIKYYK